MPTRAINPRTSADIQSEEELTGHDREIDYNKTSRVTRNAASAVQTLDSRVPGFRRDEDPAHDNRGAVRGVFIIICDHVIFKFSLSSHFSTVRVSISL